MQPLATLAELKAWVPNLTTTADDVINTALLLRASAMIMSELGRPSLVLHTVNEVRNGMGTQSMLLREWPVISLLSVNVDGNVISIAQNTSSSGYFFMPWDGSSPGSPQQLSLRGYRFCRGFGNVQVNYTAGHVVAAEPQVVAAAAVTASSPDGSWAVDNGVTYANGTALVKVASAPAVGQYQLVAGTPGKYTLNAADNGQTVLLTYSFIPGPLVQACCELVAERYRYRSRIGQKSVSVDGKETASYDISGMTDFVKMAIQPFKKVALI